MDSVNNQPIMRTVLTPGQPPRPLGSVIIPSSVATGNTAGGGNSISTITRLGGAAAPTGVAQSPLSSSSAQIVSISGPVSNRQLLCINVLPDIIGSTAARRS